MLQRNARAYTAILPTLDPPAAVPPGGTLDYPELLAGFEAVGDGQDDDTERDAGDGDEEDDATHAPTGDATVLVPTPAKPSRAPAPRRQGATSPAPVTDAPKEV